MIDKILIVGFGSIGKRHLRLVKKIRPEIQTIVLRHSKCHEFPAMDVDYCVTRLEDALKYKPQAAIIANPSSLHLEIANQLANEGIHLLIEKPISNTIDGVQELIDICSMNGAVLMTGYNLRFLPSLKKFRDLLKDKLCGRVFSVRTEVGQYLPSWRPDSDYRQNVSANAALGGGVLLELSHEIDYMRWLFGEIEWVTAIQLKQSNLEIDVEDSIHMIMGFSHEVEEIPVVGTVNMDFIRHDSIRSCTVIAEKGTLRWNGVDGKIDYFEQGMDGWRMLYENKNERDSSFTAELEHFFDCIATGDTPLITGHDGFIVMQLIDAIRESSFTGLKVFLDAKDDVSKTLNQII